MFSIVIPLFNKEAFICNTIASVLAQSFQKFEIIIINDGSTDRGVDKIRDNFTDPRIRIINQNNLGVSAARNIGIQEAKFEYVAFLDADDLWHKDYLLLNYSVIRENPETAIIGSHYKVTYNDLSVDWNVSDLNYVQVENYFKHAHTNTLFTCSSAVVKTSILKENKGFRTGITHGEDSDMWFRIMMHHKGYYIHNTLVNYNMGDPNQATKKLGKIENTLVGNILYLYQNELRNGNTPHLELFIKRYILLNLMPYYINKHYHSSAREILAKIKGKPLLPSLFYSLPRRISEKFYHSPFFRKGFRKLAKI